MIPVNPPSLRTRQEAKAWLLQQRLSIAEWARAHNLQPQTVHSLLNGHHAGARGASHDAAVLLGMKVGVVGPVPIGPQAGPADKRRRVAPSSWHQDNGSAQGAQP